VTAAQQSRRSALISTWRASEGLGRLLATRFATQWGDGLFQAALGGAVLFNPERRADPAAIAAGLAVLLLPYSLVGPFAGALLDRWSRARVLVWANLLRAGLIVLVAAALAGGLTGAGLYLGALAVTAVSRFVLSGLSAALPHVTPPEHIVGVNSALATAGAVVAVLGAGSALGVRAVVGSGNVGSGLTTAVAALGPLVAGLVALGFPRPQLGPDQATAANAPAVRAVATGLVHGARAAWAAPGVAAALAALGAHRLAFGINTLLTLLLMRYAFTGHGVLPGGLAGFSQVVVVSAVGLLGAAVLTPVLVARLGRQRTITIAMGAAVAVQLALVPMLTQPTLLLAALLLTLAGQVTKLSADAAMQLEVDDAHRGQVFALQDALFNIAYVGAVAGAATVVAPDGRSLPLVFVAAAVYVLGLAAQLLIAHRRARHRSHRKLSPAQYRSGDGDHVSGSAMVNEIDVISHGIRCGAWHLPATTDALTGERGRPCVVMGHGFGATRDSGLLSFAERFAAAGADVLLFDYRGYGSSDGTPRQQVSHRRHRQDYHAALATARALDGVDPQQLVLWGSSYSGGHVIAVAAQDGRVAAVISQGAAMDGAAALWALLRGAGAKHLATLTGHGLRDAGGALLRRAPHHIAVVGPPGALAAITAPGAEAGYGAIMGPSFRNEMCARGVLGIALNRPVRYAKKLRCPLLLVIAAGDNIAPPDSVRTVARRAGGHTEVLELPCGHFDIYTSVMFEESVAAQVAFLGRQLTVATSRPRG